MLACDRKPVTSLDDRVAALVEPLDTAVTLAEWMRAHATDTVSADVPVGEDPALVCRSAAAELSTTARRARRSAVFHFPQPPRGERFPDDTTNLARQCVLRALWIDVAERDSLGAIALADSIGRTLTETLGAPASRVDLGSGAGQWTNGGTWRTSGTTVVLGVTPHQPGVNDLETGSRPEQLRRVIVAAYGAASGLGVDDWQLDLEGRAGVDEAMARASLARADSAIGWSALGDAGRDLRAVASRVRQIRRDNALSRDSALDTVLVRGVKLALDAAASIRRPQRAAALLAIDLIVAAHAGILDMDTAKSDNRFRQRLDSLGARYEENPLGAVYTYARPFLWEAQRLDPLGPAGRTAFVELMATGFNTHPGCQDTTSGFRRVIADGERALARRDRTDPVVQFFVAEAYADIVAMASGVIPREYVDPKDFVSEAPAARRKAIAHYRAALAGLRDTAFRRAAWLAAFRLGVGAAPRSTHFVCIYD
jgi:hypothetical protein